MESDDDNSSFSSEAQEQLVSSIIQLNKGSQQAVDDGSVYPKALGVTVDDLVNSLNSSKKWKNLKKQVSQFRGKTLEPPEHRVQTSRNKRQAAYETTKMETNKWNSVVNRIESAQVLDFTDSVNRPKEATTVNELVNWFQPQRELEKEVDRVIKESLVEYDVAKEYRDTKKSEEKDVEAVRSYKAKMRALMSYFEQKQRRIKRIKSKRFRRARRSKRNKSVEESKGNNWGFIFCIDCKTLYIDSRIEERMSLRHKNTSKWVKRQLQRNAARKNETAKAAIQEQLEIGRERLQKRNSDEIDEQDSSDGSSSSDEDIPENSKDKWNRTEEDDIEALEQTIQQIDTLHKSNEESSITLNFSGFQNFSNIGKESREFTFATPSRISIHTSNEVPNSSDVNVTSVVKETKISEPTTISMTSNPWVIGTSLASEQSNQLSPNKQQPLIKHDLHRKEENKNDEHRKESLKNDVCNDISCEKEYSENKLEEGLDSDVISTSSEDTENKYYLKRAFVEVGTEDNDFEEEKQREIDEEMEVEQSETLILPGWGTWGGAGIKPRTSRYAEKVKRENERKKEAAKANRKDSKRGLEHVIISEKRVKQTAALTVPFVPAPMKSREEYERTTKMPLGKEWLRFESYQKAIRPSIIAPIGSNIETISHKRISGTRDQLRL